MRGWGMCFSLSISMLNQDYKTAEENVFEHTGIRIMRNARGDLLFCDPGSVTGIRDSFMVTAECIKHGHLNMVESGLLKYIQTHEQACDGFKYSFPSANE